MDLDSNLNMLFGIPVALMEVYISKKKYSSTVSPKTPSKDRGTIFILWLIILCAQISSIHCTRLGYGSKIILNKHVKYFVWIPFSISLFFIGLLLRIKSIDQLGKWFTTAIRTTDSQQLIDVGLYRKMRHPSYAGVLLYFFGLSLLLNNWLTFCITMIPISSVFYYRIHIEEQELKKHFGKRYEEYKQKVPYMIIPKVF
ncbi:unnamed protein product [Rotaria magnacalcarata]|uniref:Protein-S-isoprenylcysteine O-methyltransferase n=1 Tax=Rotaria magnacalcarata TaxID=392030 RepID=A0A819A6M1_9BILA|nr:unnamed protein product [Rotaria magnacalcarata]CAF2119953.1 unnamed protein product [Rotaria magnacalcarata]CAF3777360.1 unnamed protein product [Rotaria magnacalcarata]